MKKILYVANITQHIIRFHLPYLKWFKDNGYEVHVAANGTDVIENCDVLFTIPIQRTPFSLQNFRAYTQLSKIIDDNKYELVIGNTSLASFIMRLAALRLGKNGAKVVYYAHGLNFYKGASIKDWFIYYPVEYLMSYLTDLIITINTENYNAVSKWKGVKVCKVNGVGVKTDKFIPIGEEQKLKIKKENGYDNKFILVYVAEFIQRKNHKFIIDLTEELSARVSNIKILFVGRGALLEEMKKYANDKKVNSNIDFLGFRTDVPYLLGMSDVGISTSRSEGLPINIVEEMFMSLPIVGSVANGHNDLIETGVNGFLYEQDNATQFIESVVKLAENKELRLLMGTESYNKAQFYSLENAMKQFIDVINSLSAK
jgi:glycosyltransferase EpsD